MLQGDQLLDYKIIKHTVGLTFLYAFRPLCDFVD